MTFHLQIPLVPGIFQNEARLQPFFFSWKSLTVFKPDILMSWFKSKQIQMENYLLFRKSGWRTEEVRDSSEPCLSSGTPRVSCLRPRNDCVLIPSLRVQLIKRGKDVQPV